MAGPTFSFDYLPDQAPRREAIDRVLRSVAKRFRDAGSIFVDVAPARSFGPAADKAIAGAIGGVPATRLEGYAMANGDADWDALREVASRLAELGNGWVITTTRPTLDREGKLIEVTWRDLEAFFGPMTTDAEYVRANEALVPEERLFIADARAAARFAVAK